MTVSAPRFTQRLKKITASLSACSAALFLDSTAVWFRTLLSAGAVGLDRSGYKGLRSFLGSQEIVAHLSSRCQEATIHKTGGWDFNPTADVGSTST